MKYNISKGGFDMLQGYDFSHYNSDKQVSARYPGADFVCHKLTEGTGYTDPKASARAQLWKGDKPTFWYHLVRPDKGNTAAAEASHYITQLAKIENYGPFGLALDLEANYVPYNSKDATLNWICDLIRKIKAAYNKTVLCYMGDLYPDKWYKAIREAGGAIWIARWGKSPVHKYEMWQDTSTYDGENLDHDVSPLALSEMWRLIGTAPVKMTPKELAELALGVICGNYGIGEERKKALGDKYYKVQNVVNIIMKEVQ